jgi:hypothetical protein
MDVVTTNPLTLEESTEAVCAISNFFGGWVRHSLII